MKSGQHLSGRRDIGNGIILVHKLDDYKLKIAQFLGGPYIYETILLRNRFYVFES